MATPVVIGHLFQSLKADGPDPTLVRPSNWNANHKVTGGADGQFVVFDSTSATGLAFASQVTTTLVNQTGSALAVGDAVAVSLAADGTVVLSDVSGSALQFVFSLATPANAAAGPFVRSGPATGLKAQGAIPAGNYIRKSATSKAVEDTGVAAAAGTGAPAGSLGIATSVAAAGLVNAWLFGVTTVVPATPAAAIYTDELTGLGLTFTSTTAVTVAAGAAASDDGTISSRAMMVLASLQGTTAGTWVVGNAQPKLDAGTVGNNQWWHVFAIVRPDTGVTDILFSLSPTAPTLPTNYTKKRRLGAFLTNGSAQVVAFVQTGELFTWTVPPALDVNTTNPGTAAITATLSVPTGVVVEALVNVTLVQGTAATGLWLSALAITDTAPSLTASPLTTLAEAISTPTLGGGVAARVLTNTSGQIRYRCVASDANTIAKIVATGWRDYRGRGV